MSAAVVAALLAAAVWCLPGRASARAAALSLRRADGRFLRPMAALRRWSARGDDVETAALIEVVESLDAALAAGSTPADALACVAALRAGVRPLGSAPTRVDTALPSLLERARAGEGLAAGWADLAATTGSEQVATLARAWALSESSGTSLSVAARTAARLLRQGRDEKRRTRVAVAGARATMTILTALPLGGPALALLLGLDPGRVYLGSPAVALMLVGGVLLVLAGRWWVRRLVSATLRGPGFS